MVAFIVLGISTAFLVLLQVSVISTASCIITRRLVVIRRKRKSESYKKTGVFRKGTGMSEKQREPITSLEDLRRYAEAGGLDGPVPEKKRGKRSKYVKIGDEHGTNAIFRRSVLTRAIIRRRLRGFDDAAFWVVNVLGGALGGSALFWGPLVVRLLAVVFIALVLVRVAVRKFMPQRGF